MQRQCRHLISNMVPNNEHDDEDFVCPFGCHEPGAVDDSLSSRDLDFFEEADENPSNWKEAKLSNASDVSAEFDALDKELLKLCDNEWKHILNTSASKVVKHNCNNLNA